MGCGRIFAGVLCRLPTGDQTALTGVIGAASYRSEGILADQANVGSLALLTVGGGPIATFFRRA